MSAPTALPLFPGARLTGRRSLPRLRLGIPAQMLLLKGLERCLLDDLSQSGARVTLAGLLPSVGAGVVLTAQGLDVFGTVIWARDGRVGIAFEEPLPLHNVVNLRHFADSYAEHEAEQARRNACMFVQGRPGLRRFG